MCEYCEEYKYLPTMGDMANIEYDGTNNYIQVAGISPTQIMIIYCPMCGVKVGEIKWTTQIFLNY